MNVEIPGFCYFAFLFVFNQEPGLNILDKRLRNIF